MKKYIYLTVITFLLLESCADNNQPSDKPAIVKEKISGLVQKGPFVSGTSVLMNELTSNLVQTGKIFSSTISNDLGAFAINNIELSSSFVEFTSTGFYFNEVEGIISNSPLTLTSLSDIKDKTTLNVNVLTHLEKKRVETLIKGGKSFSEAKTQSRSELLSIFSISSTKTVGFEDYDISKNTEEGGILLAISIILQEDRTVGKLTELLSQIQNDISDDGQLDDVTILSALRAGTANLDFSQIRKNIETRYSELNLTTGIPEFEKYIINFAELKDLKISIEGNGSVDEKIISNTSGKSYPKGMTVELTPLPDKGWVFDSWAGDLSGSESPKTISIDGEKNITAKFKKLNYPLVITLVGEGTVVTTPNGTAFPYETLVELKAVPKQGWVFDEWSGDLTGTVNPQSVTFDQAKNITAKFRQPVFKIADNGVTCKCENVKVGEKGIINGVEYEVVDNTLIRQRRDEGADMTKLCTSLVTDMSQLFLQNPFNQPIGNWDVSNVTDMNFMFNGSNFNQDIGNWNVSNVTGMLLMFGNTPFNKNISNWNVGNVRTMHRMFQATPFNQPIGNWDVSNVIDMSQMFDGSSFNQPIGSWNVGNVRSMHTMFQNTPFNQPLGNWDVSSVSDMNQMFIRSSFNQPINNWNVSNVADFSFMFYYSSFNQSIENWNVSNASRMEMMFEGSPFNQPIGNWNVSKVTSMRNMFLGTPFNQPIGNWNVSNVINMLSMFMQSSFNQSIENWNVSSVTNMYQMFSGSSFNQPIGNWDVSKVTNMSEMFFDTPFNQPIGNWDVSNVTNMTSMFMRSSFNQPIGNWNVSKVTKMNTMFHISSFNQPIGNWNVGNVRDIAGMFGASPFNQPIGNWNVRNVINMNGIFWNAPFNQNISKWCVTNFTSEPLDFSNNLATENKPVWGTCP